jgi:ankyrin repeat protein
MSLQLTRDRFLVAMLHVTSLKGKVNVKQIKEALHDMSSGGDALLKAYEKSMEMIQSQEKDSRSLAMTTLAWVAFSPSTLTLGGLQHALAAEVGNEELNSENVTEPEIILSTCAGLLTLQHKTYSRTSVITVHLVHETTQAYLNKTKDRWFPGVDVQLAQICLTYLSYTSFSSGPCPTWKSWHERTRLFPLYESVADDLGLYVGTRHPQCRELLERLYLSEPHVRACLQGRLSMGIEPDDPESKLPCFEHSNALFLAIKHKIYDAIPFLVSRGLEQQYMIWDDVPENRDEADQEFSLVHYAVRGNFPECIQILVSTPGVNCNVLDNKGRTALSYACESGRLEKVQLLLGLDLGAEWSPGLEYYYENGVNVGPPVSKADLNYRDRFGRTALTYALVVEGDFGHMTKSLLSIDGIDCTSPDEVGRYPIHWAAGSGVPENVRLLLMQPSVIPQLRIQDSHGRTPLSFAIDRQHVHVARALLALSEAQNITPEVVDQAFSSIMSQDNIRYDYNSVLLSKLLVPNSPFVEDYGSTMVHIAARSGSDDLKTLLSIPGITVNLVDKNNRTPLWHCFDNKSEEMCQRILSRDDVDVNKCDKYGNGPIHLAAEWGVVDLMSRLLEKPSIRFGDKDFFGTPLHYATYKQHVEIVRLLLEKYKATGCSLSLETTKDWPSNPNTLQAERYQSWLANDMPSPSERAEKDKSDLGEELLAIASANDNSSCFLLLESYLGIWTTLPRVWKRKCLLAAAESGGDATLEHILKILHEEEHTDTQTPRVIHLGRQSWDDIDVFDVARRASVRELNSWDNEGQTAIHAAVKRKDMRTVRICMAMGGDHTAKNMMGQVAEDYMQLFDDDLDKMNKWVYDCMIRECLSEKYRAVKRA